MSKLKLFYLIALSMLGFVATDMYLPAFKAMENDFVTGPEPIALSLTVFLVGMAVGQLLWGWHPIVLGYAIPSQWDYSFRPSITGGIVWSSQIWQLLVLRFIQAVGVCAQAVIWQAMVIKHHSPNSQRLFATIMPLVALSPALAPQVGVLLLDSFGWQSIFVLLTLIGVILLLATLQLDKDNVTVQSSNISADIKSLLSSKVYMGNVTMFAMASAAFFAYLTGMPEIMAQLGYSAKDIGLSFIPQTIAFMVGGMAGKHAVSRFDDNKVLCALVLLFSVSAISTFITCQFFLSFYMADTAAFLFASCCQWGTISHRGQSSVSSCKDIVLPQGAGLQNSLQICVSSISNTLVATYTKPSPNDNGHRYFNLSIGFVDGLYDVEKSEHTAIRACLSPKRGFFTDL